MEQVRLLENCASFAGGIFACVFSAIGWFGVALALRSVDTNSDKAHAFLHSLADELFLAIFGAAAAIVLLTPNTAWRRWFGFLELVPGKAAFFTLSSMYVLGTRTGCKTTSNPWIGKQQTCWLQAGAMQRLSLVSGFACLAVGVLLVVLAALIAVCGTGGNHRMRVLGTHRGSSPVHVACAVAAFGQCIVGLASFADLCDHGVHMNRFEAFESVSRSIIVLTKGIASLTASLYLNAFTAEWMAFLDHGLPSGMFFLLSGMWHLGLVSGHKGKPGVIDFICWHCAACSMAVGGIILLMGSHDAAPILRRASTIFTSAAASVNAGAASIRRQATAGVAALRRRSAYWSHAAHMIWLPAALAHQNGASPAGKCQVQPDAPLFGQHQSAMQRPSAATNL